MLKKMKFGINSQGYNACEPGTRILVLTASASNEGSDEHAHTHSLVRAFVSRIQKFKALGTKGLFRIIGSSNHRKIDIKYTTPKMIIRVLHRYVGYVDILYLQFYYQQHSFLTHYF